MKIELSTTEVQQAVTDYLAKRGVVMECPTLRTVKRDKADVIVAEGEMAMETEKPAGRADQRRPVVEQGADVASTGLLGGYHTPAAR